MSVLSIVVPGATSPRPTASVPQPAPQTKVSAAALTTHPFMGILGVFMGAGIATLNARLLSVGLPDLRGAMGFGVDEAQARSLGLLQAQVRKQAATLSYVDGFVLLEWSVVLFLILAAFLKPFSVNYRLLSKAD
jgi:MFS transporter, DHA2 family, multidrug resistance protein